MRYSIIKQVLEYAHDREMLRVNPLLLRPVRVPGKRSKRVDVPTAYDMDRIYEKIIYGTRLAGIHELTWSSMRVAIVLGASCGGMRRNEVCGLMWENITADRINIVKGVVKAGNRGWVVQDWLKTEESNRWTADWSAGLAASSTRSRRHHLRADQDRPGALVSRDLSGHGEQGRDLGHGAAAADGLWQLRHGLGVAAQDWRAMVVPDRKPLSERVEADETLVGGARPGKPGRGASGKTVVAGAVESRRGQLRGRLGRLRLQAVADASASSLVGFLGRNVASPAQVATDGWSGYRGLEAAGYAHQPIPLARSWGDAALRLPAIHLVFGLAKRWLLGTHHGAVSAKHLQAYLDEYVFRFNRRTAKSIAHRFARLIEQAVLTQPTTYRAIFRCCRKLRMCSIRTR